MSSIEDDTNTVTLTDVSPLGTCKHNSCGTAASDPQSLAQDSKRLGRQTVSWAMESRKTLTGNSHNGEHSLKTNSMIKHTQPFSLQNKDSQITRLLVITLRRKAQVSLIRKNVAETDCWLAMVRRLAEKPTLEA